MNHFCTLFDRNYLLQGMALYRSLRRHAKGFVLYTICMDEQSFAMVSRLQADDLKPIPVSALEDEETRQLRARTTHGQFCWASQPLSCLHLLDRFALPRITYLDADSMFFADPQLLFDELGDASVSLVPHRYSKGYDQTEASGRYCVQFNAFRNSAEGRAVLAFWRSECFKYSKDRLSALPGQTCLDRWPAFRGVREIEHRGAGVAPWNVQSYRLSERGNQLYVDDEPIVFYHYHQYGRYPDGAHELGYYRLPDRVVELIYRPYARELEETESWVKSADPTFHYRRTLTGSPGLFARLKRRLRGNYNVYPSL
ncbi:MAG: hypothetical protein E6J78_20675 [Deltaproteobacteria bacterium]|nr:MAG: hypothetical protein E6J78_20675 [Deltaproteobacteria bacterium]